MTNGSGSALGSWERDLGGRIGRAVATRRTALLVTAAGLAERTANLGHPLSATAIAKIENNERSGRVDVAELLVLAAALEIPPVLLLFPGFPDGTEQVLPEVWGASDSAVRWFSGTDALPGPVDGEGDRGLYETSGVNAGISLVELVNETRQRQVSVFGLQIESDGEGDPARVADVERRIGEDRERLEALPAQISDALADLWGEGTRPDRE